MKMARWWPHACRNHLSDPNSNSAVSFYDAVNIKIAQVVTDCLVFEIFAQVVATICPHAVLNWFLCPRIEIYDNQHGVLP